MELEWRKVKEDHAPPRPVYPSGTHPHPPHLSEPVSGKPYRLVEPPRGSVNEQMRGDANCSPLVHGCSGFQGDRSRRHLSVGQACDIKAPPPAGVSDTNMLPWTMSLSIVLEDGGANKPTPFYIRFHI